MAALGLLPLLAACNGASSSVSISLDPTSATVPPSGTATFTATVAGASDPGVSWAATCGTMSGTGSSATYTASAIPGTCTVTATSIADSSKSASATVRVVAPADSIAGMSIPDAVSAPVTTVSGQLPDAPAGGASATMADGEMFELHYDEVADIDFIRPGTPWLPGTVDGTGAFSVELTATPEPDSFGGVFCDWVSEAPTIYTLFTHDGPLESSATSILGVYARIESDLELPAAELDRIGMLEFAPLAWQVFVYSSREEEVSCREVDDGIMVDVHMILAPGWNSVWAILRPEMVDGTQLDHGYIRSAVLPDLDAAWIPLANEFGSP